MTTSDISIAIIQSDLAWQNRTENLKQFSTKIKSLTSQIDLIILPEMFTTGFSMEVENLSEDWNDSETLDWLKENSKASNTTIIGSFIVKDNTNYFNRLVACNPNGEIQKYDKRHLFRMANEHLSYSEGNEKIIVDIKGWKICPFVCYDLRFPVWSRNSNLEYDLLIYVANWPNRRALAWNSLLRARAIENLSYSIGVNRVGTDGNDIYYSGNSSAYDYIGNELFNFIDEEKTHIFNLSKNDLAEYRTKFPAHLDADKFQILQ